MEELQGSTKENLKMAKLVSSCHTLEHLNSNLNNINTNEYSEGSHISKLDSPHFNSLSQHGSRLVTQGSGDLPRFDFHSGEPAPSPSQLIYYNFNTFKKFWEIREKTKPARHSPHSYAFCTHPPEGKWMPRNREGASLSAF